MSSSRPSKRAKRRCNICKQCHVVDLAIEIKSLEALKRACKRLGWKFLENQKTYKWNGHWVDDSPIPEHIFTAERAAEIKAMSHEDRVKVMNDVLGKCDHAISVPGCGWGIGVLQQGEEFKLVWDWWYRGGLHVVLGRPGGSVVNPIPQAYAVEAAKLAAEQRGQAVRETVEEDGTVQLRVQVQEW